MHYVIQGVPPVAGDVFPLLIVADTKARHDATAGGTPLHGPAYRGRLAGHKADLLESVRDGSLKVCDSFGKIRSPDWLMQNNEHPVEIVRPCPGSEIGANGQNSGYVIDEGETELLNLTVSLTTLNAWAADRGDHFEFAAGEVEWIDERGIVVGTRGHKSGQFCETPDDIAVDAPACEIGTRQPVISVTTISALDCAIGTSVSVQESKKIVAVTRQQDQRIFEILASFGYKEPFVMVETGGRPNELKQRVRQEAIAKHGFTESTFKAAWSRVPKRSNLLNEPVMK